MSAQQDIGQLEDGPLGRLALSRSTVDRATDRRGDAAWLAEVWADPRTRVLVVQDGQALVTTRDGQLELVFVSPAEAPEGTRFFLGVDADGIAYFGVSGAVEGEPGNRSDSAAAKPMAAITQPRMMDNFRGTIENDVSWSTSRSPASMR